MTHTLILSLFFFMGNPTADDILPANVHHWNELEVQKTKSGDRRQVLEGATEVFEHFEIHVTTLRPGLAPHGSHVHQDHEIERGGLTLLTTPATCFQVSRVSQGASIFPGPPGFRLIRVEEQRLSTQVIYLHEDRNDAI